VNDYSLALFIHILGVITFFGGMVILQRAGDRLRAAETVGELRLWLSLLRQVRGMFGSGAFLLLASGLYMTNDAWTFTTSWVLVAIVTLVAMVALGSLVVGRSLARIGAGTGGVAGESIPNDVKHWVHSPRVWSVAAANNGAAIGLIWLMTNKPGWTASIAIVVVLAAAGGLIGTVLSRREVVSPRA
jgi:hypothetical protein